MKKDWRSATHSELLEKEIKERKKLIIFLKKLKYPYKDVLGREEYYPSPERKPLTHKDAVNFVNNLFYDCFCPHNASTLDSPFKGFSVTDNCKTLSIAELSVIISMWQDIRDDIKKYDATGYKTLIECNFNLSKNLIESLRFICDIKVTSINVIGYTKDPLFLSIKKSVIRPID